MIYANLINPDTVSYRVETRGGVKLIFGSLPIDDFEALIKTLPSDSLLDPDVARICDANFAMGSQTDLARLRESETPAAIQRARIRYADADERISDLGDEGIRWLAVGYRGASSESLFTLLTGWPLVDDDELSLPRDPSDFTRCRLLIEEVPTLARRLPCVVLAQTGIRAGLSEIINRCDELCELQDSESPLWRDGIGRASALYARLQTIGKEVTSQRRTSIFPD